jgi:AbrB family looped-hinge helix DNA binding protein
VKLAQSRVTAQGQVSVPAEVRRRLGIVPGASLEWDAEGELVVVRRAGRFTSAEIHAALFDRVPAARDLDAFDEGIRAHVRKRHARR